MNRILAAAIMKRACTRGFSTSKIKFDKADISHIKKKQIHFQVDDGVPVHLKGGQMDSLLYYSTVALTFFGLGMSFRALFKLATKDK